MRSCWVWSVGCCLIAAPLTGQRDTALRQVRLPHTYYWLEMYVPQVTSGPSSVAWSPDGRELVYSMQGTLWRQAVTDTEAVQLTDGPGYDFQPDWSPDGSRIVFSRWAGDTIELQTLDVPTLAVTPLTRNGAVNLEPRWSPDGGRIAFVSSADSGRWHVFLVPDSGGPPQRLTVDRDGGPRRYYSRWDHYLSPTWSPDGKELILVSDRGHTHGSGGFWRVSIDSGAELHEIRYEETTWKARPDWSPDGHRVVYSSYLGRQWNQLWLMTPEGGDPVQLTYGEFDATAPRWSPDGSRIAYISNEGGNTSLWVLELPGGRRTRIEARARRYRNPVARLRVIVTEPAGPGKAGVPLAARVTVTGPDGRAYAPDDAWRHADLAFDRGVRASPFQYFDVDGSAWMVVPAGTVRVDVTRGPEYRPEHRDVTLAAGASDSIRISLGRLANLPLQGYWSGDLHVHMNYGGTYRNTPAHLVLQARAEDLHVVENLVVNKEQRIPDIAYWQAGKDPASTKDYVLYHGQEFHTGFWDHTGILGLRDHYLLPDYAGDPNTALASAYPPNAVIADLVHAQGGLFGYVHPFDSRPDPFDSAAALSSELPVDVALGKVDYLEVMGFSNHLFTSEVWYRLLNCGFRLPAGAGTDAFPNFVMLHGPVGLDRVYVHTGPTLDHGQFLAGLKAGRTFVTNGPLVTLSVLGHEPGDELQLTGSGRVPVRITLVSNVPVDHLELIMNGRVALTIPLAGERTAADTTFAFPIERSGWLVARAWGDGPREPVLDLYPFASTSPVYLTVSGAPVRSREDAAFFVRWIDRVEQAAEARPGWNSSAERDAVLSLLGRARAVFGERADQARD